MKILRIYENNINDRYLSDVIEALRDGHIIIYPTDSVYAFGADALNKKAVEQLCRLKGLNPEKNLLSIVCSDLSQASEYAKIDNAAFSVLKRYVPGPFTFVLNSSTKLPKIFKSRKTIGLRIPDNAISRAIAEGLGNPLLTGSVDIDDKYPDASVEPENLALTYSNDVAVVIDGGHGRTEPTTIVDITDVTDPVVVREGLGEFE